FSVQPAANRLALGKGIRPAVQRERRRGSLFPALFVRPANQAMHTPVALLEFTGKVLLRTASFGLAGDLTEVLPQAVQEVWTRWSKERSESQRRAEIEALIQTPAAEIRQAVAELVQ